MGENDQNNCKMCITTMKTYPGSAELHTEDIGYNRSKKQVDEYSPAAERHTDNH